MVTRAINLKIVVPRKADANGSAATIWSTHSEVNLATRHYEELLLTLRQQPVFIVTAQLEPRMTPDKTQ